MLTASLLVFLTEIKAVQRYSKTDFGIQILRYVCSKVKYKFWDAFVIYVKGCPRDTSGDNSQKVSRNT